MCHDPNMCNCCYMKCPVCVLARSRGSLSVWCAANPNMVASLSGVWVFWWDFMLDRWVKRLPHWLHWYGFSPLCTTACRMRLPCLVKLRPHWVQVYGRSPVWLRRCSFSWPNLTNVRWQYEHPNRRSPFTFVIHWDLRRLNPPRPLPKNGPVWKEIPALTPLSWGGGKGLWGWWCPIWLVSCVTTLHQAGWLWSDMLNIPIRSLSTQLPLFPDCSTISVVCEKPERLHENGLWWSVPSDLGSFSSTGLAPLTSVCSSSSFSVFKWSRMWFSFTGEAADVKFVLGLSSVCPAGFSLTWSSGSRSWCSKENCPVARRKMTLYLFNKQISEIRLKKMRLAVVKGTLG